MRGSSNSVETFERRVLLAASAAGSLDLIEGDGTRVAVSLVGPGTMQGSIVDGQTVLRLDGTTERTTLTITPDAAAGRATLGKLDVNGSLGRIVAPGADVAGDVTLTGALRQATLGDISGGKPATLRIGAGQRTALRLGRVKDLNIEAPGTGFGSITALSWEDDPANGRQRVTASSIARLAVYGGASFDLYADKLGAVTVALDLADSKIMVLPGSPTVRLGLASLTVGGAMRRVWVNTLADVGFVSSGGMFDSTVMAGVAYVETAPGAFEQPLPADVGDKLAHFTGTYGVRSVTVSNRVGQAYAFENSRIAAYRVGSVKIDDIKSDNGKRPFGVSAYYLSKLLRKFGGADAPKTFQANPVTDFVGRQLYRPLVFRPEGGYGGYTGGHMGFAKITIHSNEGWWQPVQTEIPLNGLQVGSVVNHPSATAVFLNPDGTYDARDAAGALVSPAAALADVLVAVAGTTGVSMKVEVAAPVPASATAPAKEGSVTFLSTSAGAEVVMPDVASKVIYLLQPADPLTGPLRQVAPPTLAATMADLVSRGVEVTRFDKPLLRVRPGGAEIARVFDDEGLRRVRLLPDHTYAMTDESGATLAAGASLSDVMFHGGPWLGGRQRRPAWVNSPHPKVTVHGLARGGTAVYDAAAEVALDPAGNTFTLPVGDTLRDWLRGHGIGVT